MLYKQLVAKYPNSLLVPDAHLALGEIAFGRNQFPAALAHFDAIREYPKSRVYPYGLYKAAWTHYNMRDAAKGLEEARGSCRIRQIRFGQTKSTRAWICAKKL